MAGNDVKPWYQGGLRFTCTQCGDCCTGAPGYVWVTNKEIAAIAELRGMTDVEVFEKMFVRRVGVRKSLREFSNGDCVLLDGKTRKCTVYDARPRQCRSWPFWPSNLRSEQTWQATCEVCPGSGAGKLHPIKEIEAARQQIRI